MNEIDISLIYVDEDWNCRGRFLLHDVQELAGQMRKHGLIQPVVLQPAALCKRKLPDGKQYRLIAGFRRFTAASVILKWTAIKANIVEVNDAEAHAINLIENLERKDLNVVQEAQAMERLYPRKRYTLAEIAESLKKHTSWVQTRWHLLRLPEDVQQMFASGRLKLAVLDFVRNAPDAMEAAKEALARKQAKLSQTTDSNQPRRRRKSDVKKLITRLIDLGLEGLVTRALAWTNGYISNAELEDEIQRILQSGRPDSGDHVG